jgi:hypothetical protein
MDVNLPDNSNNIQIGGTRDRGINGINYINDINANSVNQPNTNVNNNINNPIQPKADTSKYINITFNSCRVNETCIDNLNNLFVEC